MIINEPFHQMQITLFLQENMWRILTRFWLIRILCLTTRFPDLWWSEDTVQEPGVTLTVSGPGTSLSLEIVGIATWTDMNNLCQDILHRWNIFLDLPAFQHLTFYDASMSTIWPCYIIIGHACGETRKYLQSCSLLSAWWKHHYKSKPFDLIRDS